MAGVPGFISRRSNSSTFGWSGDVYCGLPLDMGGEPASQLLWMSLSLRAQQWQLPLPNWQCIQCARAFEATSDKLLRTVHGSRMALSIRASGPSNLRLPAQYLRQRQRRFLNSQLSVAHVEDIKNFREYVLTRAAGRCLHNRHHLKCLLQRRKKDKKNQKDGKSKRFTRKEGVLCIRRGQTTLLGDFGRWTPVVVEAQ